jgi:predicted  nucleic acid-binding Zn-ribbon protein
VYGIAHRQQLLDYLALRNYSPSERVIQIADDTTMKDTSKRVFYINHPELSNKQQFRQNCPSGEQSIVLGCYIQRTGIFILDVKDERLNGVVPVTAAHELLHAQYDRLSDDERTKVDQMTSSFFNSMDNPRIKKSIEEYRAKDSSVVPNELHSILGTEVSELPPELEQYYGRYFENRRKVVDYSEKYEETFVELTRQVERYDNQLKALKPSIQSSQKEIEGLDKEIEFRKNRLDSLVNSGNVDEYNSAVPEFNQLVNEYNQLVNNTKSKITQYNFIAEKRNDIVTTEQELVEAINSNASTRSVQ